MNVGCFQWFKDTNSKANHNFETIINIRAKVVFNGSKILIRKQITTDFNKQPIDKSCFQWFKDTNSKANHNHLIDAVPDPELFSMVQRY